MKARIRWLAWIALLGLGMTSGGLARAQTADVTGPSDSSVAEDADAVPAEVGTRGGDPRTYRSKLQAGGHRQTSSDPEPTANDDATPGVQRNPRVKIGSQREDGTLQGEPPGGTPPRRRPASGVGNDPQPSTALAPLPARPPLRRVNAQQDLTGSGGEDTAAVAPPRPPRNWKKKPTPDGELPQAGDIIAVGKSGKKNLAVVKRLGGGAWGEVFVVEDQGGELSVMKQQKPWPKTAPEGTQDNYGEYRKRVEAFRKATGGKARLLGPDALVKEAAKHEVDMQNLASSRLKALRDQGRDVPDFVDEAELVGRGRIKQRFAGATFDNLLEDVDGMADDDPVKEASVRVLLKNMLQAAAALDSVDMVHRDLHTGNIALDSSGRPKLLDFGLAKRKGDPDLQLEMRTGVGAGGTYGAAEPPETRAAKSRFLNRKATPEQIEEAVGYASGHKADVYSIGQILATKVDPNTSFSPILKSPRKELVELLDDLRADDPAKRPTAADALLRLETLATPDDTVAATRLQGFSAKRSAAALAEPSGPSTIASGSPQ